MMAFPPEKKRDFFFFGEPSDSILRRQRSGNNRWSACRWDPRIAYVRKMRLGGERYLSSDRED